MRPTRFHVLGGLALCAALCSCGSPPSPTAPSLSSFSVEPSSVTSGVPTTVTISFAFDNTPSPDPTCSIDGLGPVTDGQQTSLTLTADTTFTLRCSNSGGESTKDAQVTVVQPSGPTAPQLASFSANPTAVVSGTATDVTWTWSYSNTPSPAPTCSINGNVGAVTSGATTSVTLTADTVFTLTCTNTAGSATADVTITTVAAAGAPAISMFWTIPSSVIAGSPTRIQWYWAYSVAPTPAPTCRIDQGVGTVTNASFSTITQTVDTTYTLTCTNSAGSGSRQVTITATPPVAPSISVFVANPSSVATSVPTSVQWKWTYSATPTPAPTCSIDQGVGTVTNGSSTTVTQTTDTTYTLTCTNSAGTGTQQVTVPATPPVAPTISTFAATPPSVLSGTSTSVTWTWSYGNSPSPAPTCSIDHGVGALTSGTSSNVTLTADTVFTLTCTNAAGSTTSQATITVSQSPAAPVIATFIAAPSEVQSGVSTSVQWNWTYSNTPNPADSCSIDQGVGAVTNGQVTVVNLTAPQTYTLTCTNSVGSGTAQTTIILAPVSTISNGGFELGKLTGWQKSGTTSVVTGGHSGTYAALLGNTTATVGDSTISQRFTASTGATSVSFWYQVVCLDDVAYDWATATLTNNSTGVTSTVLAKQCSDTGAWQQATAPVIAGTSYTLTLINHDDGFASDPTYTLYDDVTLQ